MFNLLSQNFFTGLYEKNCRTRFPGRGSEKCLIKLPQNRKSVILLTDIWNFCNIDVFPNIVRVFKFGFEDFESYLNR
jgi:hypothetical protein